MEISVLTEDGHTVLIPDDLLPLITLVYRTVNLKGDQIPDGKLNIPIPKIRGSTFAKVLEWASLHRDDPNVTATLKVNQKRMDVDDPPVKLKLKVSKDDDSEAEDIPSDDDNIEGDTGFPSFNIEDLDKDTLICPADRKLLESLDIPSLIDLTAAANYLAIESLLDVCCKSIANHMTGLSVEELRLKFNIPNDFTPDEEAKLKAEFGWADE